MTQFPQVLLNVPGGARAPNWRACRTCARRSIDHRRSGRGGRVLVRFSGTEPLVRVMVEGESLLQVQGLAEEIAAAIRSELTP